MLKAEQSLGRREEQRERQFRKVMQTEAMPTITEASLTATAPAPVKTAAQRTTGARAVAPPTHCGLWCDVCFVVARWDCARCNKPHCVDRYNDEGQCCVRCRGQELHRAREVLGRSEREGQ